LSSDLDADRIFGDHMAEEVEETSFEVDPDVFVTPATYKEAVQAESRPYPRGFANNGIDVTTVAQTIRFDGPFGAVTTLSVKNTSATADAVLVGEDQTVGIRVIAGERRTLEFDTPTYPNSSTRRSRLIWVVVSSAIDAAGKLHIDVS